MVAPFLTVLTVFCIMYNTLVVYRIESINLSRPDGAISAWVVAGLSTNMKDKQTG